MSSENVWSEMRDNRISDRARLSTQFYANLSFRVEETPEGFEAVPTKNRQYRPGVKAKVQVTDYELLEEVEALSEGDMANYLLERAERIVRNTQGDSWDDPEEWQIEAAELAHAVYKLLRDHVK